MILLIDNYDSFVFNLGRYFERLGQRVSVVRNTAIDADGVEAMRPDALVLSPGPCTPQEAGCSLDLVRRFTGRIPILGVCLGHLAIAEALGGRVVRSREPVHGRASLVRHDGRGIFAGLPDPIVGCRYHSLAVDESTLPNCLVASAHSDDGTVMAIRHRQFPVVGLQFHPESILTDVGFPLLAAFLRRAGQETPDPLPDIASERRHFPAKPDVSLPRLASDGTVGL